METKTCNECGETKNLNTFPPPPRRGRGNFCKKCLAAKQKRRRDKDVVLGKNSSETRKCRCCGVIRLVADFCLGRNTCRLCLNARNRELRQLNREKINRKSRERGLTDKQRKAANVRSSAYRERHHERCLINERKSDKKHRETNRPYKRKYLQTQRDNLTPVYLKDILGQNGFLPKMITLELMEVKKLQLQIKREIQNRGKENEKHSRT